MKESKICYFKELRQKSNVLLSSIIGLLLGLFLFLVDKFNMPNGLMTRLDISIKFRSMVISLLYSALLSVIALVVLILLVKSFSKKVIKEDSMLLSFDFFSLVLLVAGLAGVDGVKKTFVIVLAIIAIVITLIRVLRVKEHTEETTLNSISYRKAIVKRVNVPAFVSIAVLIGIFLGIAIYYVDFDGMLGNVLPWWVAQSKFDKIGYVAGICSSVAIGFNVYTVLNNKNIKFSWIDTTLVFTTIVSFFSGLYFSFDLNKPIWHFHAWGAVTLILLITTIFRSMVIDAESVEEKNLGKSGYYFLKVADKFSLISLLFCGFVISGLFINIDVIGLNALFSTIPNVICSVFAILIILVMLVGGIVSLVKNTLRSSKIAAFDYVLMLSLVIGGVMIFDLYYAPTIIKLVLWLVAFILDLVFVGLRIHLIEREVVETEEVVKDIIEESVVEEIPSVVEKIVSNVTTVGEDMPTHKNVKHYYINKLKFTNSKTKSFYSDIKNFLLSHNVKSTITRRNETFRKSGLVCKLSVSGKTLRIHLPLNPNDEVSFNINKYHQFSLESKKRYADVPFTMKIRSLTACKRAIELLEKICLDRDIKLNSFYQEYDFVKDLDIDGRAIFDKACCLDMLVDKCDVSYADKFDGEENPSLEKICSYIPTLENRIDELNHINGKEVVIDLDKVISSFNDEVVSLETLKRLGLASNDCERLVVHVSDSLNKPVAVICDDIDNHSALVILATGGKIAFYQNGVEVVEDFENDDIDDEDDDDDFDDVDDLEEENTIRIKARKTTFVNRLKFTSDKTKAYYSVLKNRLLSYGIKSRATRRNEQFRKSGLFAKISISGKTLRLHLPLDPNDLESYPLTKYHQIDLTDKKQYSQVPFTVKIKSDRALKRALQLIDDLSAVKSFRLKRKYEDIDFTENLVIDGSAIFEKLNCVDRLTEVFDDEYLASFKEECAESYEKMVHLIPSIDKEEPNDGEIQNVYIDTVLDKIDGNEISLSSLKDVNIISKATNRICVKIHSKLDKSITVICDEITPEACLAVLSTGGKVILTK